MQDFGRLLIVIGCLMAILGFLLTFAPKIPFLGKLPGDILVKKQNFTFYFPLTTSILFSIILTLVFYFLNRR